MQISLLTWPAQRLVRESVLNHNLRHPEARLDEATSPWPDIVGVIYAFVRHELTNYDMELKAATEGVYDEEKRNALAARVMTRARTAFPWLKTDPRPFPKEEKRGLELDRTARKLADLRTYEYHVRTVLAETEDPDWKKELRERLEEIRQRIANLTIPFKVSSEPEKYVGAYSRKTVSGEDYDWFGHSFHLNYLEFFGFRCPVCGASVMYTKRAILLGQGRKRFLASCHCVCVAMEDLIRLKSERWREILAKQGIGPESPPGEKGAGNGLQGP